MITYREFKEVRLKTIDFLKSAGIIITQEEKKKIEVADFGLSDLKHIGLQILVYVNTKKYCAKELVMLPRQICPEHRHPKIGRYEGKEETFRCRFGIVYLYIPGSRCNSPSSPFSKGGIQGGFRKIHAKIPKGKENCFTVFNETILTPGKQYTIEPNTLHWFQAGKKGAIVSEFSTQSIDEKDIFTDPKIERITKIRL